MANTVQTDTAKLESYYQHALNNSGTDQFYIFLYRYVDTIVADNQLYAAAMRFWLESLASDFQKDKEKLEQFTEKATVLTKKPSLYQINDFFLSTFSLIDKTKIKETKPYYCWYELYNCFYGIRALSINPENIKKIGNLDFKSKEAKELLGDVQLSDKDIAEFKSLDFDKLAAVIELETQSVIPIKTKLSRDDYLSCLIIFHTDFMSWLTQYFNGTNHDTLLDQDKPAIQPITNLKLEPKNYDAANGILNVSGLQIEIIKQPNKKGSVTKESKQARVMRLVFNDVNSMKAGVPMRKVFSVRADNFTPHHRKKIKSYVSEINSKLPKELGISELLVCSQLAVMVDNRYLL